MNRTTLMAVVAVALLSSSLAIAAQHPQDGNYSMRPLGAAEVVTPSNSQNETGGFFQARNAAAGMSVIPDLNSPSGVNETLPDRAGRYYQGSAPGQPVPQSNSRSK